MEGGHSNNDGEAQEQPAYKAHNNSSFNSFAKGVHLVTKTCPPRPYNSVFPKSTRKVNQAVGE